MRCTYRTPKSDKNPLGPCPGMAEVKGGKWKDVWSGKDNKVCTDSTGCSYIVTTGHNCNPSVHVYRKQLCYSEIKRAMTQPDKLSVRAQTVVQPIIKKHFEASGRTFLVRTQTGVRCGNRKRHGIRPSHPTELNFKVEEEHFGASEGFLRDDIRVGKSARHLFFCF